MARARSKISMQPEHSTVRVTGLFMRNLFARWSFPRYLLALEMRECMPKPKIDSNENAANSFLIRCIIMQVPKYTFTNSLWICLN